MKKYKSTFNLYTLKKENSFFPKVKITCSNDAEKVIRQFYSDDIGIYESFFVLLLNRANTTVAYAKISQGGVVGTVVDPVLIAKYAVESLAKGAIIAHNHPSGTLHPSDADLSMTQLVKQALSLFQCQLVEHLILTETSYYSLADNGQI